MLVSIVHLSDIHFSEFGNTLQTRSRQLAAAICETDLGCNQFIVVLSGDIAQSGAKAEYAVARFFLDAVKEAICRSRPHSAVHFISVPGNHDCYLPEAQISLRNALIEGLLPTLDGPPDRSILASLLNQQEDYFSFSTSLFAFPKDTMERVCGVRTVDIDGKKLLFNLYNTALLSRRTEEQGLRLPIQVFRSTIDPSAECDLSISVFHHPYYWLDPNDGVEFRDHIELTCEIALTGHQHVGHGFEKHNFSGETVFYSEGHVLQEAGSGGPSGFRVILLDLGESTRRVVSYSWKKSIYSPSVESDWTPYSRPGSRFMSPRPSKEFLARLSDSGIGLTHSAAGPLTLDRFFIYPDAAIRKASALDIQRDVPGSSLLNYMTDTSKLLVHGLAFSGKSSLAKTVAREWLRARSFYPILISGRTLRSADSADFDRLIDQECGKAYGAENVFKYRQLPTSSRALLIDDWDGSPLEAEGRNSLLKLAGSRFGKVVLFAGGLSYVNHLLGKIVGRDEVLEYDFVALKEMSYVARGQVIDNWLSLETPRTSAEFSRRVRETERLVDTVIGKKTLPSLPFYVLAILEANQRNRDLVPDNGSFGYLYEVLITGALNTTLGRKPQLDRKYQFLSLFAFRLFQDAVDSLSVKCVEDMVDLYARDWIIRLDKSALLADLEYSRVLVKRDGFYSFGYAHYFHYFLARHFKANLYGEGSDKQEVRKLLYDIAKGLNVGSNGIFLMFVVYLTNNDELLTEELVRIGDRILTEFAPSDFGGEVEFYNSKANSGMEVRVDADSINLDQSRQSRREAVEALRRKDAGPDEAIQLDLSTNASGYSDDLPFTSKIAYAVSCIQILGQILRNFTGSLPGDQKLAILRTTYLLGLRLSRAMLVRLGDAVQKIRATPPEDLPISGSETRDLAKALDRLLSVIGQILGASAITIISNNVGSSDIEAGAYLQTLDAVGRNPASELVHLAIRLDHSGPDDYPYDLIKDLQRRFEKNLFAQRVLAGLVIANMHVFDIGWTTRQKVLSVLGIKAPDAASLSRTNKRLP
jgi:predicted MPP superfamily phosphohydrolase